MLASGVSLTSRKRQDELKNALKQLIQNDRGASKAPSRKCRQLLAKWREQTDQTITQSMFDEAVRALQDDEFLVRTGDVVRLC